MRVVSIANPISQTLIPAPIERPSPPCFSGAKVPKPEEGASQDETNTLSASGDAIEREFLYNGDAIAKCPLIRPSATFSPTEKARGEKALDPEASFLTAR
jgi:hypothetical protein